MSNNKSSSSPNQSTATSVLSTNSVKPSFFCSSLEAFSKCSIFPSRSTGQVPNSLVDLARFDSTQQDEEPTLANWDKWLKIHKVQQDRLSAKLNRPPQCMLMNSNISNLYVNQEKIALNEAASLEYCDKYRGHTNFWETGETFKNDGRSLGTYQTVHHRYDRSHPKLHSNLCPKPRIQEYVGVPDKIYEEKELIKEPCLPTSKAKWDGSEHVVRKEEELEEKLKIIRKHKPDITDIIVVGKSVERHPNFEPFMEGPLLEEDIRVTTNSSNFEPFPKLSKMSVKIGDEAVEPDSQLWVVYFGESVVGQVSEISILIKNIGESCLKYSWEIVPPNWTDSELPLKHVKLLRNTYFFDKNDAAILPGCEGSVKLQFKSDMAGVFCEKWELRFCHIADKWNTVIVDLQAVVRNQENKKLEAIQSYIESCTSYSIARKAVEELLKRNMPERLPELPYSWKFFEEEIFVYNNPELFYDSNLVHKLKSLHRSTSEGPWDYSVKNLRNSLMQRTVHGEKTTELESLLAIVYELMKTKRCLCSFEKDRYKTVYDLMCCFVNQIEAESVYLQTAIGIPKQFLNSKESEIDLNRTSITSVKLGATLSQTSKNISSKRSLKHTTPSSLKHSFGSKDSTGFTSSLTTMSLSSISSEQHLFKKKKQEYLEALFVKTYGHLSKTISNMSAVLESYDSMRKKSILKSLKESFAI